MDGASYTSSETVVGADTTAGAWAQKVFAVGHRGASEETVGLRSNAFADTSPAATATTARTYGWSRSTVAGRWPELELAVLGAFTAGSLLWYLLGNDRLAAQNLVCWLSLTALHIWWIVAARRVVAHASSDNVRRFWPVVQISVSCFLLGDIVQLVAIARGPLTRETITGIPAQAILVLVGLIIMVGGMLTLPLGFTSGREHLRFWMDAATVLAAGIGINFYLLTPQALQDPARQINNVLLGSAIYLVGQFAVAKLLLSTSSPFTRRAGLLMLAAAVVEAMVQATDATTAEIYKLDLILAGTVLGNSLAVSAALVQSRQFRHSPSTIGNARKRPFSLLPYGAIVATYGLLVLMLLQSGLDLRAWAVLAAAIVSTSLVIARQILAFVDNARLAAALDVEVRQRKELAAELEYRAHHDRLTGLANRALFTDRVDAAVNRSGEDSTAVIIIDLDDFKPVNDRYGHRAGDALLAEIAARLRTCVRENDTVARLGGDEFAILMEHTQTDVATAVAARIVQAVAEPIAVAGETVVVGASVGVAVDLVGKRQADALLHGADSAMYVAKNDGKNSFKVVAYDD